MELSGVVFIVYQNYKSYNKGESQRISGSTHLNILSASLLFLYVGVSMFLLILLLDLLNIFLPFFSRHFLNFFHAFAAEPGHAD